MGHMGKSLGNPDAFKSFHGLFKRMSEYSFEVLLEGARVHTFILVERS
jgi:hypothetical protein